MDHKVSIITVSYNAGPYIERTIQSVISQTYPNIEYIIIDGKSSDNTVDIIKKYAEHIDHWISEPDNSLYDAMNKGLRKATGEYVWYMNAGDRIYDSTSLEYAMKDANNSDFIYGDAILVTEDGRSREYHKKTPGPDKLSPRSFMNGMVICHHSMIPKRSVVVDYDLSWEVSNDIDWAIRVLKNVKKVHYSKSILCWYLDAGGGVSNKSRLKAVMERFDISKKHFGLFPTLWQQVIMFFHFLRRGRVFMI